VSLLLLGCKICKGTIRVPSERDPLLGGDEEDAGTVMSEQETAIFVNDEKRVPVGGLSAVSRKKQKDGVSVAQLTVLIYFTVCGGPIGSEEVISVGGPFVGILAMIVFPWLYSVPVALVSAELSTRFPEDSSFTLWIDKSFGRFWAFQDGYWSWVSGVLDNAMYPTLAAQLIVGDEGWKTALLTLGLSLCWASLNFMGVKIVGRTMVALGAIVILPYVILVMFCLFQAHHRGSMPEPPPPEGTWHIQFVKLLHVVFWSYSGWDSVSTFAGEVAEPRRTYPLALALAVTLTCASYILPLGAGLLTSGAPHWRTWKEGSFNEIASTLGGPFMGAALNLSTAIALFAMYVTEVFIDSFLLLGMAQQRLAPSVFKQRNSHGAPAAAIWASLAVIAFAAPVLDFIMLMQVNNALTCLSVLIELCAAIILRFENTKYDEKKDEFRAPISNGMFVLALIPAILFVSIIVVTTLMGTTLIVRSVTFGIILVGLVAGQRIQN